MDEKKKDAALDEEDLKDVTGGGFNAWVEQAWAKINGNGSTDDNKEQQP